MNACKQTTGMLWFLVLLMLTSGQVLAEARREGGDNDPLRRAQYMIRQLSQEKSKLEAETARLNAELKDTQGQVAELEKKLDRTEGTLAQSKNYNEKLVDRINQDVERFKELMEKYRETVATLKAANEDNQYLVQAVTERNQWIDQCRAKNEKMYQANVDLLDRYRNKSAWDALKQDEPLTGISSVELENEAQDYRFRLEDLQVTRFAQTVDPEAHRRAQ